MQQRLQLAETCNRLEMSLEVTSPNVHAGGLEHWSPGIGPEMTLLNLIPDNKAGSAKKSTEYSISEIFKLIELLPLP